VAVDVDDFPTLVAVEVQLTNVGDPLVPYTLLSRWRYRYLGDWFDLPVYTTTSGESWGEELFSDPAGQANIDMVAALATLGYNDPN